MVPAPPADVYNALIGVLEETADAFIGHFKAVLRRHKGTLDLLGVARIPSRAWVTGEVESILESFAASDRTFLELEVRGIVFVLHGMVDPLRAARAADDLREPYNGRHRALARWKLHPSELFEAMVAIDDRLYTCHAATYRHLAGRLAILMCAIDGEVSPEERADVVAFDRMLLRRIRESGLTTSHDRQVGHRLTETTQELITQLYQARSGVDTTRHEPPKATTCATPGCGQAVSDVGSAVFLVRSTSPGRIDRWRLARGGGPG